MAKFKNISGISQAFRLPSLHIKRDVLGQPRWWDNTAPKTLLAPNECVETSDEMDIALLRQWVQVGMEMDKKKRSGPLREIGG